MKIIIYVNGKRTNLQLTDFKVKDSPPMGCSNQWYANGKFHHMNYSTLLDELDEDGNEVTEYSFETLK